MMNQQDVLTKCVEVNTSLSTADQEINRLVEQLYDQGEDLESNKSANM